MVRLLKTFAIFLLGSLLAVFIPLTMSLHEHPGGIGNTGALKLLTDERQSGRLPDTRQCDICARLLLPIGTDGQTLSGILPEYGSISFADSDLSVVFQLFSRLKDRSPPSPALCS